MGRCHIKLTNLLSVVEESQGVLSLAHNLLHILSIVRGDDKYIVQGRRIYNISNQYNMVKLPCFP